MIEKGKTKQLHYTLHKNTRILVINNRYTTHILISRNMSITVASFDNLHYKKCTADYREHRVGDEYTPSSLRNANELCAKTSDAEAGAEASVLRHHINTRPANQCECRPREMCGWRVRRTHQYSGVRSAGKRALCEERTGELFDSQQTTGGRTLDAADAHVAFVPRAFLCEKYTAQHSI